MKAQTDIKEQRSHPYGLIQLSLWSGVMFNVAAVLCTTSALASPIEPIQSATEIAETVANSPTVDSPDPRKISPTTNDLWRTTIQPHAHLSDAESTMVNQPRETTIANSVTLPSETSPDAQNISKQARDLVVQESQPITPDPSSSPAPEQPTTSSTINNPLAPSNQWRFDIEPYLFIPFSINSDIFFGRGQRSNINVSTNQRLSDITSHLDSIFGVSGRVQAWKGNFGIIADGLYLTTSANRSSNGREVTLRDRFQITIPGIDVDTRNELASFSLAASYRFVNVPLRTVTDPSNPSNYFPAFRLEGYAGGRYVSVTQDVDLNPGPDFSFSDNELNAMVGGVAKLMLSPNFAFYFRGDTSILGGGNLKQFYNLYSGIDWKFSGSFALRMAYRFTQIEYIQQGPRGGDNGFNLRIQGLQLGISWQF